MNMKLKTGILEIDIRFFTPRTLCYPVELPIHDIFKIVGQWLSTDLEKRNIWKNSVSQINLLTDLTSNRGEMREKTETATIKRKWDKNHVYRHEGPCLHVSAMTSDGFLLYVWMLWWVLFKYYFNIRNTLMTETQWVWVDCWIWQTWLHMLCSNVVLNVYLCLSDLQG